MRSRSSVKNSAPLLLLLMMCAQPDTPPPPAKTSPANGPRVVLPDGFVVRVEVAADDATRQQGLMYRDRLPEGTGMLFLFPRTAMYPFWMKNTLIPLDMIWIDEGRKVVHVKANVPPCQADPCTSYPPGVEAQYVLELAGGQAAKHGVIAGSTLRFEALDGVVVR